jgi:hypothetical protein
MQSTPSRIGRWRQNKNKNKKQIQNTINIDCIQSIQKRQRYNSYRSVNDAHQRPKKNQQQKNKKIKNKIQSIPEASTTPINGPKRTGSLESGYEPSCWRPTRTWRHKKKQKKNK